MKSRVLVFLGLALFGIACGDASQLGTGRQGLATKRVTICHGTASATNPYVRITVDESALDAHLVTGHGDQNHKDYLWEGGECRVPDTSSCIPRDGACSASGSPCCSGLACGFYGLDYDSCGDPIPL